MLIAARSLRQLFPCFILMIGVLCLALFEPKSSELLAFDRVALQQGQWWRWITGHWVHLNLKHALLNLGGLGLIALIFIQELEWLPDTLAFFACCILVSAGLWWFSDRDVYVGLSGVLHGLMIYYLIRTYSVTPKISLLGLFGVSAKVLWEQTRWSDTASTALLIGGPVAVEAHLFGLCAGIFVGLLSCWFRPLSSSL